MNNAELLSPRFIRENDAGISGQKIQVGMVYPILGTITAIVEENESGLIVLLDGSILISMTLHNEKQRETIRSRAFEPAVFVAKVTGVDPQLAANCEMVIFGRSQAYNA